MEDTRKLEEHGERWKGGCVEERGRKSRWLWRQRNGVGEFWRFAPWLGVDDSGVMTVPEQDVSLVTDYLLLLAVRQENCCHSAA